MEEGIRPARVIALPSAASQRASAPTAETAAHNADPAATASQLRRLSALIRAGIGEQLVALEERGLTLAHAHTERGQAVGAAATPQLVQE
jgi:hypothetical protein